MSNNDTMIIPSSAWDTKGKAAIATSLIEASTILKISDNEETYTLIFDRILSDEITGDADDFHNISVDYSRNNQPLRAMEICQKGKKLWPNNIDLNADAVTYALDAGDLKEAANRSEELKANCPDRSKWNWRGFTFLFDYYIKAKPQGYETEIDMLISDYKKYLPYEEKAYVSDATRYQDAGNFEAAINTLEEAVKNLNAPQCALKLTDMYFERGKYGDAIRAATLGIAYAAEPQPGIRTAYLLFIRALAKDALFLKSDNLNRADATEIIKEYMLAKKYVSAREERIIDMRIEILATYAGLEKTEIK